MNILYFLLSFGLLTAISGIAIGLVCWWPVTDDRDSVAALLRRFEREQLNRTRHHTTRPFPAGDCMTPAPQRHLHLHLDSGPLHLDYQGPAEQVLEVAAELAAVDELIVQVDGDVQPDQLPLPYTRLWDSPPSAAPLQDG